MNKKHRSYYRRIILTPLSGSFLFGFASSSIATVLAPIQNTFSLTPIMLGVFVGMALLGAGFGSIVAGFISDYFGRKKAIGLFAILFFVGFIYGGLAHDIFDLFAARFIVGIGMGIASVTTPLYLAETSPHETRGKYVSLNQLVITIGILCGYAITLIFTKEDSWRYILAAGGIVPLYIFATIKALPETPSWLLSHKNIREAEKVHDALMQDTTEKIAPLREGKKQALALLFSRHYIKLVVIALLLSIFQQITGINAIIYYAPQVFSLAGLDPTTSAQTASLGIGVVNILATLLAVAMIDKAGRKKLLLMGCLGMTGFSALALLSLLFTLQALMVLAIFGFVISFAIGLGIATWVVIAELIPLKIRASVMSIGFLINWLTNWTVAVIFPSFIAKYHLSFALLFFGLLSLVAALFIYFFLPETKGKILEEFR